MVTDWSIIGFITRSSFLYNGVTSDSLKESGNLFSLTLSEGKLCFTQLVQEFIEMETWLFLTFFRCLHNQLISIHSIVTY